MSRVLIPFSELRSGERAVRRLLAEPRDPALHVELMAIVDPLVAGKVAVFVSLAENETFRLDSVSIQIDGQPAARHIYSFKELEALQKGGVQRIYTGNLRAGEHRIDVAVAGKGPGGADFQKSESFSFSKEVEPKLVGITLAGGGSSIQFEGR